MSMVEPVETDESEIPHGTVYSSLLANCHGFKAKLIEYITTKFLSEANFSTKQSNYTLILDSPSLQSLSKVRNGNTYTTEGNQHGEADYAIIITVCTPHPKTS